VIGRLAISGPALLAISAATPAAAQAVPSRAEVREALDHEINSLCGGGVESESCVSHPSAVSVRRVSCAADGATARCRYERSVRSIGGRPGWRPAETRFAYDAARRAWTVDRDFALAPERSDVEGALHWQYGSFCRALIDACLDDEGNEIHPSPEFTVSALECRPAADRRATCSFTSVRGFGPGNAQPGERCTGTLERRDHEGGDTTWTFSVPDPRRRPSAALLSCN
jgi:hypothetical protein